jgi:hypothetical protein
MCVCVVLCRFVPCANVVCPLSSTSLFMRCVGQTVCGLFMFVPVCTCGTSYERHVQYCTDRQEREAAAQAQAAARDHAWASQRQREPPHDLPPPHVSPWSRAVPAAAVFAPAVSRGSGASDRRHASPHRCAPADARDGEPTVAAPAWADRVHAWWGETVAQGHDRSLLKAMAVLLLAMLLGRLWFLLGPKIPVYCDGNIHWSDNIGVR